MNEKIKKDAVWDFFENLYNKTIKKGETFSEEMGQAIQEELEKMKKQKEDFLEKNENK